MLNICIIGAGNISNTRHIPAIKKNKNLLLSGVVSDQQSKIDRTINTNRIEHQLLINPNEPVLSQLKNCKWFIDKIDAVIIGAPPKQHYSLVQACLKCGKHVLVEKPMVMNEVEANEVCALAKEKQLVFYVMHNFQYAPGFKRLMRHLDSGNGGAIVSILETQYTNRQRRLPSWYNDLPLGLFYDEAAHFFYSAARLGGTLKIKNSYAVKAPEGNTPLYLSVDATAGKIPVKMYMNFCSPVCEWMISVFCEKKLYIYDYFKDILIVEDNDKEHLAKDVLKTSFQYFFQYWWGFFLNGFKMLSGNLLYGHDDVIEKFRVAIVDANHDQFLNHDFGREIVKAMNEVATECRAGG